jgi:hypothetical protein
MGFCIGGKACRRQDCKERCKSWYGLQPDLEKACKNACKSNSSLTKEQFQCSGKYVDEQALILAYGYDPCNGGVSIDQVLDPTGSSVYQAEKLESLSNTFLLLGILIAAGLAVLYYLRR